MSIHVNFEQSFQSVLSAAFHASNRVLVSLAAQLPVLSFTINVMLQSVQDGAQRAMEWCSEKVRRGSAKRGSEHSVQSADDEGSKRGSPSTNDKDCMGLGIAVNLVANRSHVQNWRRNT